MESKKVHFAVLLEQDEDGFFIVSCPSFKGCHSYGKTVEEAMKNIEEVIEVSGRGKAESVQSVCRV